MENDYLSSPEKNLAKFTFEVLKRATANGGASLILSEKVRKQRIDICRKCPQYDEVKHMCKACGCNLAVKTRYSLEFCPIDKWEQSDESWVAEEFDHIVKNLDKKMLKNIPPEPIFPDPRENNLKSGDRYEWNYKHWEWNGNEWVRLTNP
jgi:hypothetical protein